MGFRETTIMGYIRFLLHNPHTTNTILAVSISRTFDQCPDRTKSKLLKGACIVGYISDYYRRC